MSGRQRVDTQGAGPDQTWHWSASSVLNKELYWHSIVNIPVSSPWTRHYKKGPWDSSPGTVPVCLTDITSHHQTWWHLPGLYTPYLHTRNNQILQRWRLGLLVKFPDQTESAWEWDLSGNEVPSCLIWTLLKLVPQGFFSLKYLDPIWKICSHYRPATWRQISDY